jgi:hypothetical protein
MLFIGDKSFQMELFGHENVDKLENTLTILHGFRKFYRESDVYKTHEGFRS